RGAGPRDPHTVGLDAADLRDGDAGHQGWPAHPRREEKRGCLLHSGDGYPRAHPGLSKIGAAGCDLRDGLVDAGLRYRPYQREGLDRSGRISEHAAWCGSVGEVIVMRIADCGLRIEWRL